MHLTSMPNLTPTGIHHYLSGGKRGITGTKEGIWSKLGSEEGCFSEMRAQCFQCNSDRGSIRIKMLQCQQRAAACMAAATSLRGRLGELQPLPHGKRTQLQLTKRIRAICTSFRLTPSAKCRKSCPEHPEHTSTVLSSFIRTLYQTGLVPLVFVLPPCPQTLLCPCPVPRQGPQLCPSRAVYICPESPQPGVVLSDSRFGQTGTQMQCTLNSAYCIFIYI